MSCTFHSQENEDYPLVPVVFVDGFIHNEYGFCDDMGHECHENQESIVDLQAALNVVEITVEEADLICRAKTV